MTINFNPTERLILINQFKILSKLESESSNYYNELIQILENGYVIFYGQINQWISTEMSVEHSRFVLDILDVYRRLEDLKRRTSDKNLLQHPYSIFRGFDGNEESEYMAFTRFLIEEQGKFNEQKKYLLENDHLNSHMPMIDKYRRMIQKANDVENWMLSIEDGIRILDA